MISILLLAIGLAAQAQSVFVGAAYENSSFGSEVFTAVGASPREAESIALDACFETAELGRCWVTDTTQDCIAVFVYPNGDRSWAMGTKVELIKHAAGTGWQYHLACTDGTVRTGF